MSPLSNACSIVRAGEQEKELKSMGQRSVDGIRGLLPSKNGWFFPESKVKKKGETWEDGANVLGATRTAQNVGGYRF